MAQGGAQASGWIDAFLEMMAVERAAARNTLTAYAKDLADAGGFLAGRGRDLADAAAEDIEAYFAHLGALGLAPATAARRRASVRGFYRFVLGEGWRTDDPVRRVDAPKQGRSLPKVLGRDEVDRLIAAASAKDGAAGLRLGCMVELLYASGLRVSELVGLTLAAVARDPTFLIIKGKGGKERLAPLNDTARAAVKAYLPARVRFLHQCLELTLGGGLGAVRGKAAFEAKEILRVVARIGVGETVSVWPCVLDDRGKPEGLYAEFLQIRQLRAHPFEGASLTKSVLAVPIEVRLGRGVIETIH